MYLLIWKVTVLLWVLSGTIAQKQDKGHTEQNMYKIGQKFKMQCLNNTKEWGPGPICKESGQEMSFLYGVDTLQYCGWNIENSDVYLYLRSLIQRDESWKCRIRMSPSMEYYIPFTIPVWGVAEPDHIHIDNHLNFVFHGDDGWIIAATAYPVRDRFQFVKTGTSVTMHGPIKWFDKLSFKDFSPVTFERKPESVFGSVLLACFLTALISSLAFVLYYKCYLEPELVSNATKSR